jgi:alkylhydroperoxidase/carboxymuconolactone decarboxylase family protein YurZ
MGESMDDGLDDNQRRLKDAFVAARGYWAPIWDQVLRVSPDYFEAYVKLASVPMRTGTLDPKVRELIHIAIDSSTTHLHQPSLRIHIPKALELGATKGEIMEVLELTSVLGVHTITFGLPILIDEARKAGRASEVAMAPLTPEQDALKKTFTDNRGYWSPLWDGLIRLSPEFFEAYMQFSSVPWTTGTLDPKVRELIYIAIDSATTHMYEPGLRVHIQNALRYGASVAEILEVYQIVAGIGVHTVTVGVPILMEALGEEEGNTA